MLSGRHSPGRRSHLAQLRTRPRSDMARSREEGFISAAPSDDAPKPVVALAIGDPAGVGPELAAKLAADPDVRAAASLVVVGDRRVLERGADESALSLDIDVRGSGDAASL